MGDADYAPEERDWFGPPINTAARLCARAGPDQILAMRELFRTGSRWKSSPVGELVLKGIGVPVPTDQVHRSLPLGVGGVPLPATIETAVGLPFVGRSSALAVFDRRWKAAIAGRGSTVAVVGPPGSGRTRLAREWGVAAQRAAGTVLYGRCGEPGDEGPLAPAASAMRWWVAGRGVPRPRTHVGIVSSVARASAEHPVLLVFDDVDRASPELRAVIDELSELADGSALLLVLIGEGPPFVEVETVELDGLSTEEIVQLLAASGIEILDPVAAATHIQAETAGSPEHVSDIVETLSRLGGAGRLDQQAVRLIVDHTCPYRGLGVYRVEDQSHFFGRDELVGTILDRLERQRLVAVVGPSGSEKSSLVQAGVLPALARGALAGSAGWPRVVMTPGQGFELASGDAERLFVFVDQLEEVVTVLDARARREFLDGLSAAIGDHRRRTSVVVAIRGDFYGHCAGVPGLAEAVEAGTVLVGPPSGEELRAVIEGPAAVADLRLEDGLVDELVAAVEDQPGGLPLLSHALLETWRRRDGRMLTVAGYRRAGEVGGAVARSADEIVDSLEPAGVEAVRRLFLRLVHLGEGTEDTRRRVARCELDVDATDLVDRLVAARLLTVGDDAVEVAHEALIRAWPRLQRWLDEDREGLRTHRHLTTAAQVWLEVGCDESELYRGSRLAAASAWAVEHTGDLNKLERTAPLSRATIDEALT